MLQDKNIAIVGGGPGGLTLARLLQLKGARVRVYERDHSQAARVQGAIVDLHFDSGLKVMEAAGLMEAFKASYMPGADRFQLLDPNGNVLMDDRNKAGTATFGDPHFRPEIDRGALRDLLIDGLMPGTVVWDSQLQSMRQIGDQWELQFKDGKTAIADLVIGADGYRSPVRRYVTDIEALYSGATIIQGEIDQPETACPEFFQLVDNANLMAMAAGATIAAQPRGDGGLTFYAAFLYPENWVKTSGIDFNNSEEVRTFLKEHYMRWDNIFHSLFEGCTNFVHRPLNYFPLENRWMTKDNITLIGDAAHLMPPNGEGVNLAMLDAFDLSECLTRTDFTHLHDAISAYEKMMFDRAAPLCKESVEGISDFAAPNEESVKELIKMLS